MESKRRLSACDHLLARGHKESRHPHHDNADHPNHDRLGADRHTDSDGEKYVRGVLCITHDRPEPHNGESADQAESAGDTFTDHLSNDSDQNAQENKSGRKGSNNIRAFACLPVNPGNNITKDGCKYKATHHLHDMGGGSFNMFGFQEVRHDQPWASWAGSGVTRPSSRAASRYFEIFVGVRANFSINSLKVGGSSTRYLSSTIISLFNRSVVSLPFRN